MGWQSSQTSCCENFGGIVKKNLVNIGFIVCFLSSALSEAYPTDTAAKLLKAAEDNESKYRHFYRDIADSVDFFFGEPKKIMTYETKTGMYSGGPLRNLLSSPLCSNEKYSKLVTPYNGSAAASPERKAFWTVLSACVAAAEGAELWLYGKNFNKLDTNSNPKFLYGIFQLSTENNASVQLTCIPLWNKNFKSLASKHGAESRYLEAHKSLGTLSGVDKGKSSNASSVKVFGDSKLQRANAFCGVHEVLRANTSNRGNCLPVFENAGNRFATLRKASDKIVECLNDNAPAAMRGEGAFKSLFTKTNQE